MLPDAEARPGNGLCSDCSENAFGIDGANIHVPYDCPECNQHTIAFGDNRCSLCAKKQNKCALCDSPLD